MKSLKLFILLHAHTAVIIKFQNITDLRNSENKFQQDNESLKWILSLNKP